METNQSQYMLIFRDMPPESYRTLSPEQAETLVKKWIGWYDQLEAKGKVEGGRPLEPEGRIVSGSRGERVVDGPFAETKEVITGYFMLNVRDFEEATAIAQQCPGLPYGVVVEVRPLSSTCRIHLPAKSPAQELAKA